MHSTHADVPSSSRSSSRRSLFHSPASLFHFLQENKYSSSSLRRALPSLISIYEQTYASFLPSRFHSWCARSVCDLNGFLPFLASGSFLTFPLKIFKHGEVFSGFIIIIIITVVIFLFICLQKPVGKQYGTLERSSVVFARAYRMGDKKRHRAHRFGPCLRGCSRLTKTRGKLFLHIKISINLVLFFETV